MPSPSDPTVLDRELSVERPPLARAGLDVAGLYSLVRFRGRGGIGEVWEAEHARTNRRVAVKLLLPGWHANDGIRQRFIREGRLASTMQHRHIVDVFDVGETREGAPFIAMELVEGLPLHKVVADEGPMPWPRVKRILLQLCGALDHAHGMKIVHRDVKPSNVMLASDEPPDNCKLVDFGIAKQSLATRDMQHLTGEGQMLGSPGFMCPEQLQGKATDFRSDIYGLGCTGFYLLTGQVPFAGDSVPEMIHNALYCEPRTLRAPGLDGGLCEAVQAIFHRAVHRNPGSRFRSALDFVVALNQLGTQTIRAPFARPAEVHVDPNADTNAGDVTTASEQPSGAALSPAHLAVSGRDDKTEEEEPPVVEVPRTTASGSTPRGVVSTRSYSPLLRDRRGIDRMSWGCPEGFVEMVRMLPDIVVVQMSGLIGSSAEWLFERQLGPLMERHRPIQLFWNLSSMSSYPPGVRDASLRCLTEHRQCIQSMHLLNGEGVVGIAVSIATVTLCGTPHVYDDEPAWIAALDAWAAGERHASRP